ncbi:MAG: trypsin-like peptidase domain-containing protein [Bacteriovoracaceae bacterium]|nr:trypsin-like peptidase domain-containing protein [Bacteriovoracaceae bacterium]
MFSRILLAGLVSVGAYAAPTISFPPLDIHKLHNKELANEKLGNAPRFAVPRVVNISPSDWEQNGDVLVWSQRVTATNAVSLNFAFEQFKLSPNAKLSIRSTDFSERMRDFTAEDNNVHNQIWTPVIMSDDVTIELQVPASEVDEVELTLTKVNQGFRTFTQTTEKSGSCNVDVVCEEGDDWQKEINSVGVISTGGSTFCSGFMVNNTSNDRTPLFMTAAHCRVNRYKAASLVVYWNYQSSECGGTKDGQLDQFNTGSEFLASSAKSDFSIVKLLQSPNPEWGVTFAGFDARDVETVGATAIHHPSTDEKSISFDYDPLTITSYLKEEVPGDTTHIRVHNWDVGTTEPGSSGSPLFNADGRVIGQLHGGYASCRSNTSDWYGRIHTSWEGEGEVGTRLVDWLDPEQTGQLVTDTI